MSISVVADVLLRLPQAAPGVAGSGVPGCCKRPEIEADGTTSGLMVIARNGGM